MWKAAHMQLANYLVKQEELQVLGRHKIALLVGSVLPDCIPSFVTRRHQLEAIASVVKNEILKLQEHSKVDSYFCLHLGIVLHYVEDAFTYPHNKTFHGNFLEHCIWEKKQQQYLNQYLKKLMIPVSAPPYEDLYLYLLKKHAEYLKKGVSLETDYKYIFEVTYGFAISLLQATEKNGFCEEM